MAEAYIVDAARTAVGKRRGSLAALHPADLGGRALAGLLDRCGVDAALVDDVILGCVDTVGGQAGNIARTAWLAAGLPDHVPGVTVDRQCGSSQQAVHFAAQAVLSGTADAVVAGGLQSMSQIPIGAAMLAGAEHGFDDPFSGSEGWRARYGDAEVTQFAAAEAIAAHWGFSREEMERYALASHQRAAAAIAEGRFERETIPLPEIAGDECPRPDTSLERMAGLPALADGGRLTAAVSSQICDGASAALVASESFVAEHGLTPRARIRHISVRAADPVWMLTGPIPATQHALRRAGLAADDIDLFEVNEAFASVVMAWLEETGADPARVNVNGGAIALGHPIGATGTKLLATLLAELERRDARRGLLTMCEGGGTANVTIIERP